MFKSDIELLVQQYYKRIGYLFSTSAKKRNVIADLNESISTFYSALCTVTERVFLFGLDKPTNQFLIDCAEDIRRHLKRFVFIQRRDIAYRKIGYQSCMQTNLRLFKKLRDADLITESEFVTVQRLTQESRIRVLAEIEIGGVSRGK